MPLVILKNPGGIVSVKDQKKKEKKKYIYTYFFNDKNSFSKIYFIFISRLTPLYRIPIKKNIKLYITTELSKSIFLIDF